MLATCWVLTGYLLGACWSLCRVSTCHITRGAGVGLRRMECQRHSERLTRPVVDVGGCGVSEFLPRRVPSAHGEVPEEL